METNAETRAEKNERVKAKYASEGKAAPKAKVAKGKTNVAVVKKTKPEPGKMTVEAAEKKLTPLGQLVNARFEKIEQLDGKANDHRLAAALHIEEAKKICTASGVRFKEWAEANIKQSYETVRKLAAVGASDNPALALRDMREKNKDANAKHRQKSKGVKLERNLMGEAAGVLDAVKPEEALRAVKKFAANTGLVVISETEHKELKQAEKSAELKKTEPMTVSDLKIAFSALAARDKMEFVTFATAAIGGKFVSALDVASKEEARKEEAAAEDDLPSIPAGLRRTRKTSAAS